MAKITTNEVRTLCKAAKGDSGKSITFSIFDDKTMQSAAACALLHTDKGFGLNINGETVGVFSSQKLVSQAIRAWRPESVEPEEGSEEEESIIEHQDPFDLSKVKIEHKFLSVSEIAKMLKSEDLCLETDIQRNRGVWRPYAKRVSRLIESMILGLPIPSLTFSEDKESILYPVDGLQRLDAIQAFMKEVKGKGKKGFKLKNLEGLPMLEGLTYKELPKKYKRRLDRCQLTCAVISHGSPVELKILVYERLNQGSSKLNNMEVLHGVERGPGLNMLKEVAKSPAFESATGGSVSPLRMDDLSMLLRCSTFILAGPLEYKGKLRACQVRTLTQLNGMGTPNLDNVKVILETGLERAHKALGDNSCRKIVGSKRQAVNRALMEVQVLQLSSLNDVGILFKDLDLKALNVGLATMCAEGERFHDCISRSTGDVAATQDRHSLFAALLKSCVKKKGEK